MSQDIVAGSLNDQTLRPIIGRIVPGGRLRRAWRLEGGVSAEVSALEIEAVDGTVEIVVVKRYELADNSDSIICEYRILQALDAAGLPVPKPIALDDTGPTSSWFAMHYIQGTAGSLLDVMDQRLSVFAATLSQLHDTPIERFGLDLLANWQAMREALIFNPPTVLHDKLPEAAIRQALQAVWPPTRRNPDVLLHGDYWPGNVLWRDGRIIAVVDWEEAAWGDPLIDVSIARLELFWAYGAEAMEAFTKSYVAMRDIDLTDLVIWDLLAALRPIHWMSGWNLKAGELTQMREGHRSFTAGAIERLAMRR